MKRLSLPALAGVLLALLTAGLVGPAPAHAQFPTPQYVAAHVDPCPGALVCGNFTKRQFKAFGVITSQFQGLPNLTVTRASGGYAENPDGSLVWFQPGQARWTRNGLASFEATTNLFTWSQAFTNAAWTTSASGTATDNVSAAPDGTVTAATLIENTANSTHTINRASTVAVTSGQTYTFSIYAAAKGRANVDLALAGSDLKGRAFNLQSCTSSTGIVVAGAPVSWGSTPSINGACHIWITFTAASALADPRVYLTNGTAGTYTGDGASGVYLWGADLRLGAYPVPYCPTAAATATCAGDFINFTRVPASAAPITLVANAALPAANGTRRPLAWLSDGTTANRYFLSREADNSAQFIWVAANVFQPGVTDAETHTGTFNLNLGASSFAAGSNVGFGGNVITGGAGTFPTGLSNLTLGSDFANTNFLNGYLTSFAFGPSQSSTGQIAAATSGVDMASLSLNFAAGLYKTTTPYVRTNNIRNSAAAGASAGTPGTAPTNWAVACNGNGLSTQIVGAGTDGATGFGYVDARFFGTTTGTQGCTVIFEGQQQIAAANGQTWTTSAYVALVGGTLTNVAPAIQQDMNNSSGTYLANTTSTFLTPTASPARYWNTGTFNQATTAFTKPYVIFSPGTGKVVDVTLRIEAPQDEQTSYPTSVIQTTGAAASVATTQSTNPADVGALAFTGGPGYAPDCNGNLVSFAANNPRITCAGVTIEEARTNSVLWSQQLDNAAWNKNAGGTGSAPVVTPDAALAPDGTMTADQVVFNVGAGTSGGDLSILAQSLTWTNGASYAGGFWVKGAAGQGLLFRHVGANTYTCITTTGSWQRVSSVETGLGTSGALGIGIRQGQGCGTLNATATVFIWQVDVQAGAFIASPILTTSATVTRPADVMSYGGLSYAYPLALAGSATLPALTPAGTQAFLAELDDGTTANRTTLQTNNSQQWAAITTSGGVVQANVSNGAALTASAPTGMALRVASNDVGVSTAGSAVVKTGAATLPVGSATRLQIGNGAGAALNAPIQQIRIYPYAANDNELTYRSAGNF